MTRSANLDLALAEEIRAFYTDPLGFVMFAYPSGELGGELENLAGPNARQEECLTDLGREVRKRKRGFQGMHGVRPIRMATASGHGVGKTTLVAWLVNRARS